jgi:hypothetical protein
MMSEHGVKRENKIQNRRKFALSKNEVHAAFTIYEYHSVCLSFYK